MSLRILSTFPLEQRRQLLQRAGITFVASLLVALIQWAIADFNFKALQVALIYSISIGAWSWLLCDPVRLIFFKDSQRTTKYGIHIALYLCCACLLGYVLGTLTGDYFNGWSTLDLWVTSPSKFLRILLGSILFSFIFAYYFWQRGKSEFIKRQYTETQLRLIQAQLEPHMLFNTMANLRVLMVQDAAQAQIMLDRLINFLRSTLQASRQSQQSLEAEFASLSDYLNLMKIRLGSRLNFILELPLEIAQIHVPTLLLQPLVENSIKHGIEPKIEGGNIRVSAKVQGNYLDLCVQDDGIGFLNNNLSALNQADGCYGLTHIHSRLESVYGSKAKMIINEGDFSGALVNIQINCSVLAI